MKLVIEGKPEEIAEFASEFAHRSHVYCQCGEERLAQSIIESILTPKKKGDKDKILTEEVPAGGYFS